MLCEKFTTGIKAYICVVDAVFERVGLTETVFTIVLLYDTFVCFCFWHNGPQRARASSFLMFLDHKQRLTTVGRTPLDEWLSLRRDFYLATQTALTTERHSYPWWDSNPQSQQASSRRPTP